MFIHIRIWNNYIGVFENYLFALAYIYIYEQKKETFHFPIYFQSCVLLWIICLMDARGCDVEIDLVIS